MLRRRESREERLFYREPLLRRHLQGRRTKGRMGLSAQGDLRENRRGQPGSAWQVNTANIKAERRPPAPCGAADAESLMSGSRLGAEQG